MDGTDNGADTSAGGNDSFGGGFDNAGDPTGGAMDMGMGGFDSSLDGLGGIGLDATATASSGDTVDAATIDAQLAAANQDLAMTGWDAAVLGGAVLAAGVAVSTSGVSLETAATIGAATGLAAHDLATAVSNLANDVTLSNAVAVDLSGPQGFGPGIFGTDATTSTSIGGPDNGTGGGGGGVFLADGSGVNVVSTAFDPNSGIYGGGG